MKVGGQGKSPYTFRAKVPRQHIAALRVPVGVLSHQLLAGGKGEVGIQEAVVVREGTAGRFLAVGAVASDGALVDARHGQGDSAAEAGAGFGRFGLAGFGRHPVFLAFFGLL